MKDFLYITPYFPPQSQVGALRPLKFARHLPAFGWRPVVLCDLWPGAATIHGLEETIPQGTRVIRDYSWRAERAYKARETGEANPTPVRAPKSLSRLERLLPPTLNNPDLVPLGEHSVRLPYAIRAAHRALKAHDCRAILINADPYAALLAGAVVSLWTEVPFIMDLRDPWALCDLRRGRRPTWSRSMIDWMERSLVQRATKVILNTETTCRVYRDYYVDIDPQRFTTIRNSGDAELIGNGKHRGFKKFTLLVLGKFRRFVEGDILLEALALLKRRGVDPNELQLVITGDCPATTWDLATKLEVAEMVHLHPFVPYPEVGGIMSSADLLVLVSHRSQMRIPSKFYDYATSRRQILVVTDNVELRELQERLGGGAVVGLGDPGLVADAIQGALEAGRQRTVQRKSNALDSETAARQLATVLDNVTHEG